MLITLIEGGDACISDEHVGIVPKRCLSGNRKADTFLRRKRGCFGQPATDSVKPSGKWSDFRQARPMRLAQSLGAGRGSLAAWFGEKAA
jgi:hypothetical protein